MPGFQTFYAEAEARSDPSMLQSSNHRLTIVRCNARPVTPGCRRQIATCPKAPASVAAASVFHDSNVGRFVAAAQPCRLNATRGAKSHPGRRANRCASARKPRSFFKHAPRDLHGMMRQDLASLAG
jgi:hypothetical protein